MLIYFSVVALGHNFLDVSLNKSSSFFRDDISQMIGCLQIESNVSKPHISITQSEGDLIIHTKRVIKHCLRSNHSYKNVESTTKLINITPGANFHIPTTMHRIKQIFDPLLEAEFHIWCAQCKIFSPTVSKTVECLSCSINLSRAKSKYFVFLSFETQLKKSIIDNFDEIFSYRNRFMQYSDTIRDVHDCIQYKIAQKKYPNSIILPLTVNTDGARIYNSARESIWPIQIYLNYLHPRFRYIPNNIMVVGLHSGKPNMRHFFQPFLKELKKIVENGGITINRNGQNFTFLPIITMFTADLPAKAEVQGMKGHCGYDACSYCLHPGTIVKTSKKSKAVVRYLRRDNVADRTHNDILNIYKRLKSEPINGVRQISCMVAACQFDLINGFSIDYLHFALLGIVKKLLDLWLNSKYHAKPFYIRPAKQVVLNKRILGIKPISEITRHPRSIFERAEYKGNEYRSLLLYYLRYCLVDLLPMRYIKNFQLLSSSVYMLLKRNITSKDLSLAEARLNEFADEYEVLYGQENVTMNLHLCRHVAESVRNLGPLWAQSAFGFETNNGVLVRSNQAKRDYIQQISWKYITTSTLHGQQNITKKNNEINFGGKIIISNSEEIPDELGVDTLTAYKFITIGNIKFSSKKCRDISTIDYFIKLRNHELGSVRFYFLIDYNIYAYIDVYKVLQSCDHLLLVKIDEKRMIDIKLIAEKMIYMKIGSQEIAATIPNYFEKT